MSTSDEAPSKRICRRPETVPEYSTKTLQRSERKCVTSVYRDFQSNRHSLSYKHLQTLEENTIEKRNAYIATNLPKCMNPFIEYEYEELIPNECVREWLREIGF